jgi:hypothetical protein
MAWGRRHEPGGGETAGFFPNEWLQDKQVRNESDDRKRCSPR